MSLRLSLTRSPRSPDRRRLRTPSVTRSPAESLGGRNQSRYCDPVHSQGTMRALGRSLREVDRAAKRATGLAGADVAGVDSELSGGAFQPTATLTAL